MEVRIKVRPTGGYNGAEWPKVGDTIDLPEHVAVGMIANGHVEEVETRPAVQVVEKRPAKTTVKKTTRKG